MLWSWCSSSSPTNTISIGSVYKVTILYNVLITLVLYYRHTYVRSVQALVSHSLSQCLVYLVMMLSLERWPVDGLCFTVGLLLHYTILVSYLWLIIRPIVIVLRETRRQLYERNCFIMPFTILAWGKCHSCIVQ